eukprot:365687-Chlamydomonas_euryale.AAC.13
MQLDACRTAPCLHLGRAMPARRISTPRQHVTPRQHTTPACRDSQRRAAHAMAYVATCAMFRSMQVVSHSPPKP